MTNTITLEQRAKDKAGFFDFEQAKKKINPAQVVFLERLREKTSLK